MKYKEEVYLEDNGEKIYGEKLPVIIYINNKYNLTHITVFKNGLVHSYWWGLKNLDEIKDKIKSGKILQNIPDNIELECDLGTIQSAHFIPEKSDADFIKEIEDLINEFNNRDTRRSICESAFKTYLIEPSEINLVNLTNCS